MGSLSDLSSAGGFQVLRPALADLVLKNRHEEHNAPQGSEHRSWAHRHGGQALSGGVRLGFHIPRATREMPHLSRFPWSFGHLWGTMTCHPLFVRYKHSSQGASHPVLNVLDGRRLFQHPSEDSLHACPPLGLEAAPASQPSMSLWPLRRALLCAKVEKFCHLLLAAGQDQRRRQHQGRNRPCRFRSQAPVAADIGPTFDQDGPALLAATNKSPDLAAPQGPSI